MRAHLRRMAAALETMERVFLENFPKDLMERMDRIDVPLERFVRIDPVMRAKDITINTFDLEVLIEVMRREIEKELAAQERAA